MKNNLKDKQKIMLFIMGLLLICLMILAIINHASIENTFSKIIKSLMPFIYGTSFAYILSPLCNTLENRIKLKSNKYREAIAVLISELIFILIIVILSLIIVPQSVKSILSLAQSAPTAVNNLQLYINGVLTHNKFLRDILGSSDLSVIDTINSIITTTITPNIESITAYILNSITKIWYTIFNIIAGAIISIFALYNRKTFVRQFKLLILAALGEKRSKVVIDELHYANSIFSNFFAGKIVDSMIIGIISFIILSIMRMPYTILVSVIIGVTNIIPIVGPFIGAIPSFIIIVSESQRKALYFVIFIIILQQIDGHIIGPKCIGNATGLNTFWVIFSILFFGGLFGVIGMIIGVPLFAVAYDITKDIVYSVINNRKVETDNNSEIHIEKVDKQ